jgi:hypothetical protein
MTRSAKDEKAYRDLTGNPEGPAVMRPDMIIPDEIRPTINGEPFADLSHEYVLKKQSGTAE